MTSSAGKDAKIQCNGTSGNWSEIAARSAPPELTKAALDVTRYGDPANRRIGGLIDLTVDIETLYDGQATEPDWQSDLRDSYLNDTEVDFEFAPDRNAATLMKISFTGIVFDKSFGVDVDGEVTITYSVQISDATVPSYSSSAFSS